jgi:hypothetical protein
MHIDDMVAKLRKEFPTYAIDGGDGVVGFWCTATNDVWAYERKSVSNTETLYASVKAEIIKNG